MPKEEEENKDKIVVSPEELRIFANAVNGLIPGLEPARRALEDVLTKAGAFPDGNNMEFTVNKGSANGRAAAYLKAVNGLDDAMTAMAEGLTKIADAYQGVEDINKIEANDVNDVVSQVNPKLAPVTGGA